MTKMKEKTFVERDNLPINNVLERVLVPDPNLEQLRKINLPLST